MDCNEDYSRERYMDRMRRSVCRGCQGDCGGCRWSEDYEDNNDKEEDDGEQEVQAGE